MVCGTTQTGTDLKVFLTRTNLLGVCSVRKVDGNERDAEPFSQEDSPPHTVTLQEMNLPFGVLDCSNKILRIVGFDYAGHGFFQVGTRKSGLLQEGQRSSLLVRIKWM
jgi:hypothetical protein